MCCFALSQPLHVTPSSSPLAPLFPSSTPIVRVASCVSIALKALCIKMDALELNTSGRLRTTQLWVNHMPYIMPYGHIIMSHMGLVCAVHSFCFSLSRRLLSRCASSSRPPPRSGLVSWVEKVGEQGAAHVSTVVGERNMFAKMTPSQRNGPHGNEWHCDSRAMAGLSSHAVHFHDCWREGIRKGDQ